MREDWEQLLLRQRESGLTIAAFCRENGIDKKRFLYGTRLLKERGSVPLVRSADKGGQFVRVDGGGTRSVEIVLSGGIILRCPIDSVAAVMEQLDARPK